MRTANFAFVFMFIAVLILVNAYGVPWYWALGIVLLANMELKISWR